MHTTNITQAAKIHLLSESLINLLQDKSLRQIVVDTLVVVNHAVTLNEEDWAAIQAALKEDGDAEA